MIFGVIWPGRAISRGAPARLVQQVRSCGYATRSAQVVRRNYTAYMQVQVEKIKLADNLFRRPLTKCTTEDASKIVHMLSVARTKKTGDKLGACRQFFSGSGDLVVGSTSRVLDP